MKQRFTTAILMILLFLFSSVITFAQEPFPITIEHKFGTTTITSAPERIVSIGFTEQDPLLALGVVPVAVRYWYGDTEDAIFPWAEDEADGAQPQVLNMPFGNLNYEAILALDPDLISAVDSGITQEEYQALSQIAPTLAQYDAYVDFGMPWQETTKLIGIALGKSAEAEALVTEVEARLEEIHEQYPGFAGKSVAVAYNNGGTYGYYTAQDGRGRFFTDLGFVVPDELNEIAGDSFYADVSIERLDLLNQDLLVFLGLQFNENGSEAVRAEIESDTLLSQLATVQDGRVLFVSDEYDDALQFSTVLSLDYLYAGLVPEIAETLDLPVMPESNTCDDGYWLVEHALGETCVPENVERVVTLENSMTEAVVTLGVQPVGVADIELYNTLVNLPIPLSEDAVDVGSRREPNLETIASLNPDLIIAASFRVSENYDELNAIAPTVAFEGSSDLQTMGDFFTTIAQILGQEDKAQVILDEMYQHFASAQTALEGTDINPRFILSQTWYEDSIATFRLFTDNAMPVEILTNLGLENAYSAEPQPDGFIVVGVEGLDGITDVNFFFITDPTSESFYEESPLWNSLPFVTDGNAYRLNDDLWLFGGPLSAQRFVDAVLTALDVEIAGA